MASRDESSKDDRSHGTEPGGQSPGAWALREAVPVPIKEKGMIGVSSMHALSHIEGVYPVSNDPGLPRPFVGIVGALHGNETCGLDVVEALRDPAHPIRRALRHGTLVLIHGNPAATALGLRHTPDGSDLNRLFDFSFVHAVPRHAWNAEHYRAFALRPVIETLDALLDLHSTTAATEPFAIATAPYVDLAARLGCAYVTYGWDRPGILNKRALMCRVSDRYQPAISVECGQHDDPASIRTAFAVTERFLELLGLIPPVATREDEGGSPIIEVAHRVAKPNADFRFIRPFSGFDTVREGEKLGSGGGIDLVASADFVVLLPNDGVAVGDDLMFLGKTEHALSGAASPNAWTEKDVA